MFERILHISIYQRGLVLMAVLMMAVIGVYSYQKLSIDAVPDITNVQVQINTTAPGYSPIEAEQRITFRLKLSWRVCLTWTIPVRFRAMGYLRLP